MGVGRGATGHPLIAEISSWTSVVKLTTEAGKSISPTMKAKCPEKPTAMERLTFKKEIEKTV